MGKLTERDITEFAVDLTNRLFNLDADYFDEWSQYWEFRWENWCVTLDGIHNWKQTADELLEFSALAKADPYEPHVKEFTDDEHCVAYLVIEGDLYEKIYYHPLREDTEKYIEAFDTAAENHNMRYVFSSGALIFYDINDQDAGVIGKL